MYDIIVAIFDAFYIDSLPILLSYIILNLEEETPPYSGY
jgi:hypothetical protein